VDLDLSPRGQKLAGPFPLFDVGSPGEAMGEVR
jgi:hypothetical protein